MWPRCLVLLHVYYPDLWDEIAAYLHNLDEAEFDLYVNVVDGCTSEDWKQGVVSEFPRAQIYSSPNIGADVGGTVALLQHVDLSDYGLICKLHTKKSEYCAGGIGDSWRGDLLRACLRKPREVLDIFASRPQVTMLGSANHNAVGHGINYRQCVRLCDRFKLDVRLLNSPWVGGTMFWCRPYVMQALKDANLRQDEFVFPYAIDGTLAHAVERIFGALAASRGEIYWRRPPSSRRRPRTIRSHQRIGGGLNVFAHFTCPSGLQQAALGLVKAFDHAGVPTSCRDVPIPGVSPDRAPGRYGGEEVYHKTMLHVQPEPLLDQVPDLCELDLDEQNYRIGYWYWESDRVPAIWREIAERNGIREVWAASKFTAAALRASLPIPVYHLPPGIELSPFPRLPRSSLGIREDRFTFLFIFDMRSVMERKNPMGVMEAFRMAFRPDDPVQLVIRAHHGRDDAAQWQQLTSEAERTPNVTILDRALSREESYALIDACDCYISLHRAEGLGLTMAEAMLMGKPVVATGYSGNMDFMTGANSYLVDYELQALAPVAPYPPDTLWAIASTSHAAELMRRVYENQDEARERGAVGRREAAAWWSVKRAGERMAERLRWIATGRKVAMGI